MKIYDCDGTLVGDISAQEEILFEVVEVAPFSIIVSAKIAGENRAVGLYTEVGDAASHVYACRSAIAEDADEFRFAMDCAISAISLAQNFVGERRD